MITGFRDLSKSVSVTVECLVFVLGFDGLTYFFMLNQVVEIAKCVAEILH